MHLLYIGIGMPESVDHAGLHLLLSKFSDLHPQELRVIAVDIMYHVMLLELLPPPPPPGGFISAPPLDFYISQDAPILDKGEFREANTAICASVYAAFFCTQASISPHLAPLCYRRKITRHQWHTKIA